MTVKIISKEDWEILRKYLDSKCVILVKEEVANKIKTTEDELTDYISDSSYDFGSDADIWIDIVASSNHLFIESFLKDRKEL